MFLYFHLHLLTWYNHILKSNKYLYKLTSMSSTLDKTVFSFSTCSFWNYTNICWHFYNLLLLKQLLPWNTTDFPRNFQQQLSQYLWTVKTSLAFSTIPLEIPAASLACSTYVFFFSTYICIFTQLACIIYTDIFQDH